MNEYCVGNRCQPFSFELMEEVGATEGGEGVTVGFADICSRYGNENHH